MSKLKACALFAFVSISSTNLFGQAFVTNAIASATATTNEGGTVYHALDAISNPTGIADTGGSLPYPGTWTEIGYARAVNSVANPPPTVTVANAFAFTRLKYKTTVSHNGVLPDGDNLSAVTQGGFTLNGSPTGDMQVLFRFKAVVTTPDSGGSAPQTYRAVAYGWELKWFTGSGTPATGYDLITPYGSIPFTWSATMNDLFTLDVPFSAVNVMSASNSTPMTVGEHSRAIAAAITDTPDHPSGGTLVPKPAFWPSGTPWPVVYRYTNPNIANFPHYPSTLEALFN